MDAYSYRKEDTLLTLRGKFRNHRDREIAINGDNMWHKRPNMIGYIVGPAVNIPINCVQEPKMEHATYYDFDENFLNKILLCGYYIDYRIDKVICSHQEYNIKIQELPYGF